MQFGENGQKGGGGGLFFSRKWRNGSFNKDSLFYCYKVCDISHIKIW